LVFEAVAAVWATAAFGAEIGQEKRRFETGGAPGEGSPAIGAEGNVYVTVVAGGWPLQYRVIAVDGATGAKRWETSPVERSG
jgi:outer membrane protein assembly factor BamB